VTANGKSRRQKAKGRSEKAKSKNIKQQNQSFDIIRSLNAPFLFISSDDSRVIG
jgi:hypothetical protein